MFWHTKPVGWAHYFELPCCVSVDYFTGQTKQGKNHPQSPMHRLCLCLWSRSVCGQCGARWLCMPPSMAMPMPLITGADWHTHGHVWHRHSYSQGNGEVQGYSHTYHYVDSLTFTILKLKPSGVYQTSYSNVFTPRSSSEFAAIFGRDFLAPPNPIRIIAPGHLVGGLLTSYSTYNSV